MTPKNLRRAAALIGLAALLAACKTNPPAPDRNAPVPVQQSSGAIRMPAGVNLERVRLIDQGRKTKVYAEMIGVGDPANEKLLFPAAIAQQLGLTARQMQRSFTDTVARSRRFEVYDSTGSVTAEASDIVVDAMVVETKQDLRDIEGGLRIAVTQVRLSLQMKDRYSGKLLFPAPVVVVGQTGRSTGDRVVLKGNERTDQPEVQRRLAQDWSTAMYRAFDDAARRVDQVLRPLGRVLSVDGEQIGIAGGSATGLQGGDELVIFRATTTRLGATDVIASTMPSVVVRCDGVGTDSSQCVVVRRDPQRQPQAGDYAVLTDHSARDTRQD